MGQDWEFQALLKARPAVGDAELGKRYIERVDADGVERLRNARTS